MARGQLRKDKNKQELGEEMTILMLRGLLKNNTAEIEGKRVAKQNTSTIPLSPNPLGTSADSVAMLTVGKLASKGSSLSSITGLSSPLDLVIASFKRHVESMQPFPGPVSRVRNGTAEKQHQTMG
ncbi:hypothetical protein HAX54_022413 [Datura stramonium]|uniref:Uncharacterized protein n=1 Tax=Datura stramonium TaxID=4076 RepID=A0ABS8RJS2_DATST|nr:hypothetical protein [Datura stramonium]